MYSIVGITFGSYLILKILSICLQFIINPDLIKRDYLNYLMLTHSIIGFSYLAFFIHLFYALDGDMKINIWFMHIIFIYILDIFFLDQIIMFFIPEKNT